MTPLERFGIYRSRIERFDPSIHAYLDLCLERAEREAQESQDRAKRGEPLSPIDGYCVAVKANIAVEGLPHHGGIEAYKDEIAPEDAQVVEALRKAGAAILGTVNMHEGALGATNDNRYFGRTLNTCGKGITPGGSSGGSAAAVASALCDFALGTDTMGSVRIPSGYCGVYGHKPSQGMVSNNGLMELAGSLDHIGIHARSLDMLGHVFGVLHRSPPAQIVDLKQLSLGFWFGAGSVSADSSVLDVLLQTREKLSMHALSLSDFEPPEYQYGVTRRAGLLVSEVEGYDVHKHKLDQDTEGFSTEFLSLLKWGYSRPAEKKQRAYRHLEKVRQASSRAFNEVDFVIAPTAPQTAFSFDDEVPANQADFTAWANIGGLPATALFAGFDKGGRPLSLQVIGPAGSDLATIAFAKKVANLFGQAPLPPGFDGTLPGN